eukprot:3883471-Lingulodinium_polyedra.AAC.1
MLRAIVGRASAMRVLSRERGIYARPRRRSTVVIRVSKTVGLATTKEDAAPGDWHPGPGDAAFTAF